MGTLHAFAEPLPQVLQWTEFAVMKMVFVRGLGQAVAIDPRNRTC